MDGNSTLIFSKLNQTNEGSGFIFAVLFLFTAFKSIEVGMQGRDPSSFFGQIKKTKDIERLMPRPALFSSATKYLIYKITNKTNGKGYIGQFARDRSPIERRFWEHRREATNSKKLRPLHKALRKYGFDNFTYEVIAQTSNIHDLNYLEVLLIAQHQTLVGQWGYNIDRGGNNSPKSNATKLKLSIAAKGRKGYWQGKTHSEVSKQKMSVSAKKRKPTNLGRKFSQEWRDNISKAQRFFTLQQDNEIKVKYLAGKTIQELMQEYQCSSTAIHTSLQRSQVTLRSAVYIFTPEDIVNIVDQYWNQLIPIWTIARKYHRDTDIIKKLIQDNSDKPLRTKTEAIQIRMHQFTPQDIIDIKQEYALNGRLRDLSKKYETSDERIRDLLISEGVRVNTWRRTFSEEEIKFIIEQYNNGKRVRKIAEELKTGRDKVQKFVDQYLEEQAKNKQLKDNND